MSDMALDRLGIVEEIAVTASEYQPQPKKAPTRGTKSYTVPSPDRISAQQPWRQRRNCIGVNPDVFFPERAEGDMSIPTKQYDQAREFCGPCNVKAECLEYVLSLRTDPGGMWGDTVPQQRRAIRARRKAVAS